PSRAATAARLRRGVLPADLPGRGAGHRPRTGRGVPERELPEGPARVPRPGLRRSGPGVLPSDGARRALRADARPVAAIAGCGVGGTGNWGFAIGIRAGAGPP